MDREAWHAVVHGVSKSQTWLSNWTELNWTTPVFLPGELQTEEPGGLQSMGSQRVRHDWATELNWIRHIEQDALILWVQLNRRQMFKIQNISLYVNYYISILRGKRQKKKKDTEHFRNPRRPPHGPSPLISSHAERSIVLTSSTID